MNDAAARLDVEAFVDAAPVRRYHLLVALIGAAILFVDGYNIVVLGYIAPALISEWKLSAVAMGPVLSASLAGNVVGFLVAPALAYRYGHKMGAIGSVALFGLVETLAAASTGPWQLGVLRLFAGIGLSGALISAVAIVGEVFPARWRSSAVTYIFLGNTLGQIAAGGIAARLIESGGGWRMVLLVGGLAPLALVPVVLALFPDSLEYLVNRGRRRDAAAAILGRVSGGPVGADAELVAGSHRSAKASVRRLFDDGLGWVTISFWFAFVMCSLVVSSVYGWMTALLVDTGFSRADAVMATVVITSSGLAAGLAVGPLMDRFGAFRTVVAMLLLASVAWLAASRVMPLLNLPLIVGASFVAGFCMNGVSKGAAALAVYIYPTALRGTGIGWVLGVGRIGGTLGPVLVGWMIGRGAAPSSLFMAASAPLALGGLVLLQGYRIYRGGAVRVAAAHGSL